MKILPRYLLKEFLSSFLSCLLTLFFVFAVGRGLVQMADLIFNRNVDVFLISKLLIFSMPFMLTFIIPMSVLVATLLTFGKLSSDNEILAMRAGGISLWKMSGPLLFFVTLLCIFSYILSDQLAPASHYAYRRVLAQIGLESPAAALEEGTFIKKFKNFVIFIYEIDKNKLKGIRIYQPQPGKPTRTIIAQKGEVVSIPEQNIIKLKLIHGTTDEPDAKDPNKLYKLNFKTYDLPLNVESLDEAEMLGKKPKDMTAKELKTEIHRLGQDGIQATYPLSAEIHHKIALAFSSLAFMLIGIPLGVRTKRSERSINYGISLALMALYWTLLIAGKAVAQKGLLPPLPSLEFSNAIMGGLGLLLFVKLARS